jgi:hypothetical protein
MRRLKVDKKLVTRKTSAAFAIAMAFVVVSNVAQADSAFEWAYWDVSPSAGENSEQAGSYSEQLASIGDVDTYNGYDNITAEQMRIGFNGGELLEASNTPVTGSWVGYVLYDTRLDTGSEVEKTTNNVAVLGISPDVASGTLTITSDLKGLNIGFDSKDDNLDNATGPRYLSYGAEEGDVQAEYHGSQDANRIVETDAQSLNDENAGKYFSKIGVFNSQSDSSLEIDGLLRNGLGGFAGKVMSLADIAAQAKLGASYNFIGRSLNGSNVYLTVNFAPSTWRADFGESKYNYGYSVENGTISGATLVSANVIGDVNKVGLAESVVSGKVTGTLVGVINAGANSNAGAIGKSELNVLAVDGGSKTVKVNDVFAASIVDTVKK